MAFLDDIKSKHLGNFVLVTIGDNIRISTRKITFDGEYYKPILLNIPSISESLDIEQRKYKISSVSLSISDYMEDGVRFSDSLNTLMNKEVVIWFVSQSSKTLDDAECYKAGVFIVRSFSQDEDKVTLNCEDLSQDKLHKDLPLAELGDEDIVPDKYKNKPIPMIFGEVDRSPCLISKGIDFEDLGNARIKADTEPLVFNDSNYGDTRILASPLFIYEDGLYYSVTKDTLLGGTIGTFPSHAQFELDEENGEFILIGVFDSGNESEGDSLHHNNTNLSIDSLEVDTLLNPNKVIPNASHKYFDINTVYNISEDIDESIDLNSGTNLSYASPHIFSPATSVDVSEQNNLSNYMDGFVFEFGTNIFNSSELNENEDDKIIVESELLIKAYFRVISSTTNYIGTSLRVSSTGISFNDITGPVTSAGQFAGIDNMFDGDNSLITYSNKMPTNLKTVLAMNTGLGEEIEFWLHGIGLHSVGEVNKITNRNFYANATGRGGASPTLQTIYSEILDELDFDTGAITNNTSIGKYAFTLDKKINSKKLLEEISASSPLFPYFKNGNFNVKSIKKTYTYGNSISIDVNDVIKYKYDRSKIEKIYSSVNVKYHYDYGLGDYTKETGDVIPTISGLLDGYSTDYFGTDFDQPFVFESKYIRDEATAQNLAKYLCGLHANQHNIIHLTLPLNYLTLELGDIVRLDELIQGRKIFGEDYSSISESDNAYARNGQNIYKFWFVEQIKKSLDKVEVKLYQLHEFNYTDDLVDIIDPPEEEPEEPTSIQVCLLPNYENSYLDADGNLIDINDSSLSLSHNFDLCGDPIEEEVIDPVGYCLIGSNVQDNIIESECNQQGGEWSATPIILGCMDDNALNTNPYATNADDALCVFQTELQPPTITSPVEDEVIPLDIEIDSLVEVNSMPNPELNTEFNNQTLNNEWIYRNISYESTTKIRLSGSIDNGVYLISKENTPNLDNCIVSNIYNEEITKSYNSIFFEDVDQGDYLYIQSLEGQNAVTDFIETSGIKLYKYNNSIMVLRSTNNQASAYIELPYNPLNTFTIKFTITLRSGDFLSETLNLNYGNSNYTTTLNHLEETEIVFEVEDLSTDNNLYIFIDGSVYTHFLEIDNFQIIEEVIETTTPILNVTWSASPNLVQPIPQLPNLTLLGDYIVSLVRTFINENGQVEAQNVYTNALFPVNAVEGQETYSHSIDMAGEEITPNSQLQVNVIARSFSNYNGIDVFTGLGGLQDEQFITFPIAPSAVNVIYGEIEEEEQLTVVNIVQLVQFILGFETPTTQQITDNDFNNDGLLNIVDILLLVNIILDVDEN